MHSGGRNKGSHGYSWKPGNQMTLHDSEILERVAEGVPDDISIFSCGYYFTLFYSKSKGWFACGLFKTYDGVKIFDEEPNGFTPIPSLAKIVPLCLACGNDFYAIVSTDGKLFVSGGTFGPKLREIELPARAKFVACSNRSCIVLLDSGEIVYWYDNPNERKTVAGKRFIDCACGQFHFIALTDSGEVWTWITGKYDEDSVRACGRDVEEHDEIGKVELPVKIKRVFASLYQTFLLDEENHIWATGNNYFGRLGLGDRENRSEFERVPEFTTERIIQIKAASCDTYVVTESGKVFVAGDFRNHMALTKGGKGPELESFTLAELTEGIKVTSISTGFKHLWLSTSVQCAI